MVKKAPSNARNVGSIPDPGTKIPYDKKQLSPCVTTTEPAHHTTKTSNATTKTRCSQINKYFLKIENVNSDLCCKALFNSVERLMQGQDF